MDRAGKRCVLYSRVSTEMQVDGFSLAGQKTCLTSFAKREELRVVGEYEDAGKSGKSIEGRPAFKRMINDIKGGLKVDYVIVYKLSRFGRNAADVLNSLELIQDYGVNLICTDEGIDSSQASGRLLISVLSAVAQIERENILEQTMNGRREKARQGLWNGGQAPYGYKLVDGKLEINPDEAEIVKKIFEEYTSSSISMTSIAVKLNNIGAPREKRGNTYGSYWADSSIRSIIKNPIYIGKIKWGSRQMMKVKGSKVQKRVYTNDNVIIADGAHEPIISNELWEKAQSKRENLRIPMRRYSGEKKIHPLTGILVCPVCGETMTSIASISRSKNGKTVYRYGCKISKRKTQYNKSCDYHITYSADVIESLVKQAISSVLASEEFIEDLKIEFTKDANDSLLQEELTGYEKKLKSLKNNKAYLENQIDNMDYDEPNYDKRREDLNNRLNSIYNSIYEIEDSIDEVKEKIESVKSEMLSADVILNILKNFTDFYDLMTTEEKKQLLKMLIKKIVPVKLDENSTEISLDRIEFNFPIFKNINVINQIKENNMNQIDLKSVPTEAIFSNIEKTVEFGKGENKINLVPAIIKRKFKFLSEGNSKYDSKHSNGVIIKYVVEKYGIYIHSRHVRFVKQNIGIPYRASDYESHLKDDRVPTPTQWDAIIDALNYYDMIPEDRKPYLDQIKESLKEQFAKVRPLKEGHQKRPTYRDAMKYLKDEYDIGASSNTIRATLTIIGLREPTNIRSYPREYTCRKAVEALIKVNGIEDRSYEEEIKKFYKNRKLMGRPNKKIAVI